MFLNDRVKNYFLEIKIRHFLLISWIGLLGIFMISVACVGTSQLIYFRDYFYLKAVDVLDKDEEKKLKLIAEQVTLKVLREFEFYKNYVQFNANLEKFILEGQNPLLPPTPMIENSFIPIEEVDFSDPLGFTLKNKSLFRSNNEILSETGENLIQKQATFDCFYDLLKLDLFFYIYTGFETDKIVDIYPGIIFGNVDYDPTVREWYYRAEESHNIPTMTEPYKDFFNGKWMITVSKGLNKHNKTYAVVAVDINLEVFSKDVFATEFMGNGFIIYLTCEGLILYSTPGMSKFLGTLPAAYSKIGITDELWDKIQNSTLGSDQIFRFMDPSGKEFKFSRVIGKSSLYTERNFYILACLPNDVSLEFIYGLPKFSTDYVFFFCLCVTIFISILIAFFYKTMICTIDDKIENICKITSNTVKRVYVKGERIADFDKQLLLAEGDDIQGVFIDKLLNLCKDFNPVGSAHDKFLYCAWEEEIFPMTHPQKMQWRAVMSEIEDYKAMNLELTYV
ncbi:hypothetical protein SteCoe_524 [Stentor coeruleus]|uniref:Cache domain-containing protein n=1 Tax=Stentor coeruleus TaxID=5963 RepID=A0A1R2D3Y0_9CILI|nr:hypothetical protein SteCoe_524 [Stentor coeruleus]